MFENQEFKDKYIISFNGFTYSQLENAYSDFLSMEKKDSHVTLEGIEKHQLTIVEALHILAYTGFSAKWINQKIRENQIANDENYSIFIKNLDSALSKIPPSNNLKLFHMTDYLWDGVVVGGKLKIPNYLSTSVEDYENSGVVFRVNTSLQKSKARDISTISVSTRATASLFCLIFY